MSRSYYADDQVFQKLRAAGKTSWDEQADPQANFHTFVMRPFLEESLATISEPLSGLVALEIGCGSGPVCCYLAGRGLTVRGIDVSPTALEMARQNAADRGLDVRFDAADICRLPEHADRYDLIIDGHCLHCIVGDDDRRCALAAIRRLLKPHGLLLIETMSSHPELVIGEKYQIDPAGVLSIRVDEPADVDGTFQTGGEWFVPHRRLLSEEQVVNELGGAGFAIRFQRTKAQADARKPKLMQIRAGHRVG